MKNKKSAYDNGPVTTEELTAMVVKSVLKMMVVKWAVIYTVTKLAKWAAERAGTP